MLLSSSDIQKLISYRYERNRLILSCQLAQAFCYSLRFNGNLLREIWLLKIVCFHDCFYIEKLDHSSSKDKSDF